MTPQFAGMDYSSDSDNDSDKEVKRFSVISTLIDVARCLVTIHQHIHDVHFVAEGF